MVNDIFVDDVDFMTIEELDREVGWPLEYTATLGLAPYIRRMRGDNIKGIEIGTARGEGAYYILEQCPNVKKLYTIDPYKEYTDWVGVISQDTLDRQEEIAKKNLAKWGDRVEMVKEQSKKASYRFKKEDFDFVFIDGDHSEEVAYKDMVKYYEKVKKGGIFAGNSYNLETVRNAIKRFQNETKARNPIQKSKNNIWFFYK